MKHASGTDQLGDPEINELNLILLEQDIARFDIAMGESLLVKVRNTKSQFIADGFGAFFAETAITGLHDLINEIAAGTLLQDEVYRFAVFIDRVQTRNVPMLHDFQRCFLIAKHLYQALVLVHSLDSDFLPSLLVNSSTGIPERPALPEALAELVHAVDIGSAVVRNRRRQLLGLLGFVHAAGEELEQA